MRTITDFRGVEVFVATVETGSLTAAAARLGNAKSHVSTQLGRLEDDLGTRLLNRTTRRLSLTEAGATFYERARAILADLEEAERSVTVLNEEPRGTLRLGAPMSFGVRFLGDIVADFMARHAAVRVEMDLTDRRVDVIEERLDVVVRIGDLPDSTLIARRLCDTRMLLVASPEYLDRRGRPDEPADLREHDALVYEYAASPDRWDFEGPGGGVSIEVAGRLHANNGEVLVSAARAGLGIARLPDFLCADAVRRGSLEALCRDWGDARIGIWAVYPPTRFPSPKVRAFVDHLADALRVRPPGSLADERSP